MIGTCGHRRQSNVLTNWTPIRSGDWKNCLIASQSQRSGNSGKGQAKGHNWVLKGPLPNETRAFPRIGYALITTKTHVKIHFVQYLNFNELFLN